MPTIRRFAPLATPLLLLLLLLVVTATGCASGGAGGTPAPQTGGQATTPAPANVAWPVKTREHVDLWLHGFAMVQADTTLVPYFERGYRDRMVVLKNSRSITTGLDANRATLAARFTANRGLIGAQFLVFEATSWEELQQAARVFLAANGDVARATSAIEQSYIGTLNAYFPSAADREWLRVFMAALEDERAKFYQEYWVSEQRTRAAALTAVDQLWQGTARPALQRFLNNTQQASGDFILSLPIEGEGRTVPRGKSQNAVAVTFPERSADAVESVYTFAHEITGQLAAAAVADNTSPNDRRSGLTDRMQSAAAVRAGHELLVRVLPQYADGYARFYLRTAGVTPPASNAGAALATTFALPVAVRDAITRQLDAINGGI